MAWMFGSRVDRWTGSLVAGLEQATIYDIPLIYNLIRLFYAAFDGRTTFHFALQDSLILATLLLMILSFLVYSGCSSPHFSHSMTHFIANILYR